MSVALDFYEHAMRVVTNLHPPDILLDPAAATTYTDSYLLGNKVTIGLNATVQCPSDGSPLFVIADTLELYGNLSAGLPSAGGTVAGAVGGNGAGSIIVVARSIVGTGFINAGGAAGTNSNAGNGTTANGSAGDQAVFMDIDDATSAGKGGNGATTDSPGDGGIPSLAYGMYMFNPEWLLTARVRPMRIFSAAGGSGALENNVSNNFASGGGGGASFYAKGGIGATTGHLKDHTGRGAGGGGAGGLIMLMSNSAIPAINLSAVGGKGGNGFFDSVSKYAAGAGGGGGGGVARIFAPSSAAILSLAGGAGGAAAAGGAVAAAAGETGPLLLSALA